MRLDNVDDLDLYYFEIEDGIEKKHRVEDLKIGEEAYFKNGYRNKVIKHGEEDYMFYRFDEVQTHVEDIECDYSIEDVMDDITKNMDLEIKYASDRVEFIEDWFDRNYWKVVDLLSTTRNIQKEQKKSNSFLSESQKLDKYLEIVASYILFTKFDNKDSEEYCNGLKEEYSYLRTKRNKSNAEIIEMFEVKDEIDLINQGIMSESRRRRNNNRENHVNDFVLLEATENFTKEFTEDKSKVVYTGKDLEIDKNYWGRMGFTEEGARFREEVMQQYEEALKPLVEQLGHGKPEGEKNKIREETLSKLKSIEYYNEDGEKKVITPSKRFRDLNTMYNELKSDYRVAKEILALPISFTQVSATSTEFDYNFDTWYLDEDGNEVEISKNTVLLSEPNTYKGLIANYYDLKDKYRDNFQNDMWYILAYFEELIEETELSKEENFVLGRIMRDFFRGEIVEEYEKEFGKSISMRTMSNWTSRIIPNKLLNTYLDSVNEWSYTYKLKGKFKKCSRCGEIKTINNNRFFSSDSKNKDGFRNVCKTCRT